MNPIHNGLTVYGGRHGEEDLCIQAGKKPSDTGKWKAREGVALASCSDTRPPFGLYRYNVGDNGAWC